MKNSAPGVSSDKQEGLGEACEASQDAICENHSLPPEPDPLFPKVKRISEVKTPRGRGQPRLNDASAIGPGDEVQTRDLGIVALVELLFAPRVYPLVLF